MLFLTYILCFLFLLLPFTYCESDVIDTFEKFKKKFNKSYKNAAEERIREANFNRAVERVKRMSLERPELRFGVNDYSDLSDEEWKGMFPVVKETKEKNERRRKATPKQFKRRKQGKDEVKEGPLPASLDWRARIPNWPAEFQNWSCGHCFAFAAVATLEARLYLTNFYLEKPPNLSKQEIIDCTRKDFDIMFNRESEGCKGGGFRTDAFDYLELHGVLSAEAYPYEGGDTKCDRDGIRDARRKDSRRYYIEYWERQWDLKHDDYLMRKLAHSGPLSAGIIWDNDVFKEYQGKVITGVHRGWDDERNHAVVLMGYGHDTEQDIDYWLFRNSMGPNWGDNGYFKVERHHNAMGMNRNFEYIWLNPHGEKPE